MIVATLDNVSKSYRGRELFSDVNYELHQGKIQALEGANGSGKSVLLKILTKFVRPDSGTATINNAFLDSKHIYPQKFGVIIDRPGYIGGLTGYENLKKLADIRGVIGPEKIRQAMERVDLHPDTPQKVRNYSLGMKQRLALAQAFMEDQEVLVLDEPFNALDRDGVAEIRNLLLSFRDEGRTILFTSHNSEDIETLAETVHRINRERVEQVR